MEQRAAPGDRLFSVGIADSANKWLRLALSARQVPQAMAYGLHSLRRGASQALADSGSDLATILVAGSWRSNAVRAYLNLKGIEDEEAKRSIVTLVDMDREE